MKSYKEYILNEKKDHIIKKMPNLTEVEKELLIDFFNNRTDLESKVDWNKWKTLDISDFEPFLSNVSKSGRKRAFKMKGIAGLKEGTDYLELQLSNPMFKAYVALTIETSKLLGSSRFGGFEGEWCIASNHAEKYWNKYVGSRQYNNVPVYLMGLGKKWVVICNSYEIESIWDWNNKVIRPHEIPMINIKKEFYTSRNEKILQTAESFIEDSNIDTSAVEEAYIQMVDDIERNQRDYEIAEEEFRDNVYRIWRDTLHEYIERLNDAETEEERQEIEDQITELENINGDVSIMIDRSYDFDWTDDLPSDEREFEDDIDFVSLENDYDEYFKFAEEHFGFNYNVMNALVADIMDFIINMSSKSVYEILEYYDCYDPESVNEY